MKQVTSFIFRFYFFTLGILLSFQTVACHLKQDKKLVSLSGVTTSLLRELNLLQDPQLKAVSSFFLKSQEKENTSFDILHGGIFLSNKVLKSFKKDIVFYDQSQQLRRQFEKAEIKETIEIITRKKSPIDAIYKALSPLKKRLINCEDKLRFLEIKWKKQIEFVKAVPWINKKVIFFMGNMRDKKFPQMMILNDGFVRYLKTIKKIATYPSALDYTTWSQKILNLFLDKKTLLIGLSADADKSFYIDKVEKYKFNIKDFGVFIPGIEQLNFLEQFAYLIKKEKL